MRCVMKLEKRTSTGRAPRSPLLERQPRRLRFLKPRSPLPLDETENGIRNPHPPRSTGMVLVLEVVTALCIGLALGLWLYSCVPAN